MAAQRHPEGFPRALRLVCAGDFKRVFDHSCRSSDELLSVLARPNGLSYPRLGLAIGRKYLPRAVARNRIKRLVRESFRRHQQELSGLDFVVTCRAGVRDKPSAQRLRAALEKHWSSLSDRCRPS